MLPASNTGGGEDSQECTEFKAIVAQIIMEKNNDAEEKLTMLGDNNNSGSTMNFNDSGTLVEATAEELALPVDTLPPQPEGCDTATTVGDFEASVVALNFAT